MPKYFSALMEKTLGTGLSVVTVKLGIYILNCMSWIDNLEK